MFASYKTSRIFALLNEKRPAEVAQLVEHDLAKVGVASSNLVFCSNIYVRSVATQIIPIFTYTQK
jgi:hypothetical protein